MGKKKILQIQERKDLSKRGYFSKLFLSSPNLKEEDFNAVKEVLISADIGPNFSHSIIKLVEEKLCSDYTSQQLCDSLQKSLTEIYRGGNFTPFKEDVINIILITGINGVGKTSTVAKLAHKYLHLNPLLIAADSFKFGAVEQLQNHARKLSCDVVVPEKEQEDPVMIIQRGLEKALKEERKLVICDTSGRLHNADDDLDNLMDIYNLIKKLPVEVRIESFLVIDCTIGQQSIDQAKSFLEFSKSTGLIITKTDGYSKGGMIFPINHEYGIPTVFLTSGEEINQINDFCLEKLITVIIRDLQKKT